MAHRHRTHSNRFIESVEMKGWFLVYHYMDVDSNFRFNLLRLFNDYLKAIKFVEPLSDMIMLKGFIMLGRFSIVNKIHQGFYDRRRCCTGLVQIGSC
jgi:hypothetical protein